MNRIIEGIMHQFINTFNEFFGRVGVNGFAIKRGLFSMLGNHFGASWFVFRTGFGTELSILLGACH